MIEKITLLYEPAGVLMIDARRPMVAAFLLSMAAGVCAVACAAGTADTGVTPDLTSNASPTDPSADSDKDKTSATLPAPTTPAADPDAGKKSSSTSSSSSTGGTSTSSSSSSSSSGTSGATSSTSSTGGTSTSSSSSTGGTSTSSSSGGTSSSSSSSSSSSGGNPSTCIGYANPTQTSVICTACGGPSKPCQPNGCYNGYWCDELFEECVPPTPPGC